MQSWIDQYENATSAQTLLQNAKPKGEIQSKSTAELLLDVLVGPTNNFERNKYQRKNERTVRDVSKEEHRPMSGPDGDGQLAKNGATL